MNQIKCHLCPNLVTNQSKLAFDYQEASNYHVCNLCWLKERIKLSQRIIRTQQQLITEYQTKISKLLKKQNEKKTPLNNP